MIAIEYDQALIEKVTFLAARRDASLERELHQAVDPIYELADGAPRQQAFGHAYREFFMQLGLDRIVTDLIDERPIIVEKVSQCLVHEASRAKDEAAELFSNTQKDNSTAPFAAGAIPAPQAAGATRLMQASRTHRGSTSERTLVIVTLPESLLDTVRFSSWMRRDLLHAADILDDCFAYKLETIAPDAPRSQQNLLRDRFRVLWDVYVEGRIHREGHSNDHIADRLKQALHKVFGSPGDDGGGSCFEQVFNASSLTYAHLLNLAREGSYEDLRCCDPPEAGFTHPPSQESKPASLPRPGELCPLCAFPTHDWFDFDSDAPGGLVAAICLDYTDWTKGRGACRQCAEIYTAAASDART